MTLMVVNGILGVGLAVGLVSTLADAVRRSVPVGASGQRAAELPVEARPPRLAA